MKYKLMEGPAPSVISFTSSSPFPVKILNSMFRLISAALGSATGDVANEHDVERVYAKALEFFNGG